VAFDAFVALLTGVLLLLLLLLLLLAVAIFGVVDATACGILERGFN